MKMLRVVAVLAGALALQAALGRLLPAAHRFVDLMMVPVVWYGIAGSQRSGMLVGCSAGLLQDAWFQIGAFGLNGFKRTLIGWSLGGLGSRFDLNHPAGRLLGGSVASLADSLMDLGLRPLLDQQARSGVSEILLRALLTGLLVVATFAVRDRFGQYRQRRRLA